MDAKRFATGSLIGVVAGLVVFFVTYLIMAPSSLEKQINELANRISKLEGQFQMFTDLRNEFQNLQKDVSTVQTELGITPPATGRIISPSQDSKVSRNFTYEVEINNPSSKKFYYLANEVSGEYWPKARVIPPSNGGRITGQINEGGNPPNGIFYIVLFEVTEKEHQQIRNWLRGPDFPGLQIDGHQIDRIKVILR